MSKRGFHGMFKCCFCNSAVETSNHNFLDCVFSQSMWELVLSGLNAFAPSQTSVVSLTTFWQDRIPAVSIKSSDWIKLWQSISKCFWWNLWITKNNWIFNSLSLTPQIVARRIKFFIVESASRMISLSTLPTKVSLWLRSFMLGSKRMVSFKPVCSPSWKVRCCEDVFIDRWKKSLSATIFFDGASKGNPGTTRAGGLIISSDRHTESSFSWGLGIRSSNRAEIYSLLKAC